MVILAQMVDDVIVHKFELNKDSLQLGRHPDNDIVVDDSAVSGRHARISVETNAHFPDYQEIYIEDLQSTNGTFVNDVKLDKKQRLYHQDVVRIAWNQFKVIDPQESQMEGTVHMMKSDKL